MCRSPIHMKAILILFFLFLGSAVFCQNGYDTIIEPPPPIAEEETSSTSYTESNFDSFSIHLPTILARKIQDSTLKRIQNQPEFWYANKVMPKKKPIKRETSAKEDEEEKPIIDSPWLNSLIWVIIIGGFVAVLIWYLASSNISLFRRRSAPISLDEEEELTEDIFEIKFDKEIQSAIAAQNYRLAIRLMYLRTLRELSDLQIIHFAQEKTNSDYLYQLINTKYYKNFFQLTREFEYTWYGKFQLTPEAFALVEKDFNEFKQQLSS